jgi:hypothetical protein
MSLTVISDQREYCFYMELTRKHFYWSTTQASLIQNYKCSLAKLLTRDSTVSKTQIPSVRGPPNLSFFHFQIPIAVDHNFHCSHDPMHLEWNLTGCMECSPAADRLQVFTCVWAEWGNLDAYEEKGSWKRLLVLSWNVDVVISYKFWARKGQQ